MIFSKRDLQAMDDRRRWTQTVILKTEEGQVLASGHRTLNEQGAVGSCGKTRSISSQRYIQLYNPRTLVSHFGYMAEEVEEQRKHHIPLEGV